MFSVSTTFVLRRACLSARDYASHVACVCFCVRSVIRAAAAKAGFEDCFYIFYQRARANRVGARYVEGDGDVAVDICALIAPVEMRAVYEVD